MDEQEPTRRRGWKLTATLLVSTIICLGAFPVLLLALAMAPMLFDAPGSRTQVLPWLSLVLVVAAPIACLVGITGGWLAYITKRLRTAWTLALLPLPVLAVYTVMFGGPLFEQRGPAFGG